MADQEALLVIDMAVAPPRPTKESADVVAYLVQLMTSLPEQEREPFLRDLEVGYEQGVKDDNPQTLMDVIRSWERLILARRDPEYHKNMARVNEPIGTTYGLQELRKKFPAR